MKLKVELFVLLISPCMCEGYLSLLGGILSTAHEQIHSKVHNVAGTILGGIVTNFEENLGINQQRQPEYVYGPPQGSKDEFSPNNNPYENNYGQSPHGYRPNQNGFQQPINNNQRPYAPSYNENNRPHHNENQNYNYPYGNENERYPNNPNYDNNYQVRPNNGHYGYTNQGHPSNQNYHNNNNNFPTQGSPDNYNYPNNNGYNNQNNVYKPSFGNEPVNGNPPNNGYDSTQGLNYPNILLTMPPIRQELPSPTTSYTTEVNKVIEDDNDTQKPDNDIPLFIPLGSNDYVYGGDRINITAPKRHTDDKPKPAEEEHFPIDIRFNKD